MSAAEVGRGAAAALYLKCKAFVDDQSCAEWGEAIVAQDAVKLMHFVQQETGRLITELAQARQQNLALRDALRPFADHIAWYQTPERFWDLPMCEHETHVVTIADFKRAAAVLGETGETQS